MGMVLGSDLTDFHQAQIITNGVHTSHKQLIKDLTQISNDELDRVCSWPLAVIIECLCSQKRCRGLVLAVPLMFIS